MDAYGIADEFEKNLEETIKELMKKQEELRRSEERYRIVAEATKDIIWEGDWVNRKRYFSGKLYEILGYTEKELEDLDEWFNILHPDDRDFVEEGIRRQMRDKSEFANYEYRVKCKNGSYKWIACHTKCEFNNEGSVVKAFGSFSDITKIKEQQKRIHDLAYYDSVTKLPNRIMLSEVINEKIQNADENKRKFAMIFMDLDNFKSINDSYGHLVGDKLLVEVGNRLKEVNNEKTMFFRLGGDEFIVLIDNIGSKNDVNLLLLDLDRVLGSPIMIDSNMFHVTHSGGIVIYPEHGDNFNELLKNADTAMYKSKEAGKGTSSFYRPEMGIAAIEKARIEADLHRALENNEFVLYYQPIVDIKTERIKGCEALIRWIHPEYGMVPPGKFISVAEENGTILEIGKWVFEKACEYAKRMYESGYTDFYVSVNISTHQLLQKGFTDYVLSTIKRIGINPELILIEITESVLIDSIDLAIRKIVKLRKNNIKIALDDFGCGYSSLTYLKMLPINTVKIDRAFLADIESEEDTKNMTNIIILMAKQLGLNVIAEGVEEKHQLDYLRKHGCDMFQGYLKSKPVPEEEFEKLMEAQCECQES